MRRLSAALIAAVSAVAITQVASAADLPVKAPAPVAAPAYNWTGFYIGANIGGGWGSRDTNSYAPNDPAMRGWFTGFGTPPFVSLNSSGVIGGLQLGYNWQFSRNWLVGLETDFDWSGIKGSGSSGGFLTGTTAPFSVTADEHIKWFGTVRARLGYLPTDNLLAYITGGFAYGRVQHNASYVNTDAPGSINSPYSSIFGGSPSISFTCNAGQTCLAGSSNNTATGWTLGGGLEYALWQKWTLKAEYLYVSLNSTSVTETALTVAAPGHVPASFNANFDRTNFSVARVGVNYRF